MMGWAQTADDQMRQCSEQQITDSKDTSKLQSGLPMQVDFNRDFQCKLGAPSIYLQPRHTQPSPPNVPQKASRHSCRPQATPAAAAAALLLLLLLLPLLLHLLLLPPALQWLASHALLAAPALLALLLLLLVLLLLPLLLPPLLS
jgi:hypothetical protein